MHEIAIEILEQKREAEQAKIKNVTNYLAKNGLEIDSKVTQASSKKVDDLTIAIDALKHDK